MIQEKEYHAHQGVPVSSEDGYYAIPQNPNDKTERIHNYDNDSTWTIETYNERVAVWLAENGAEEKPCYHDGHLFVVNARLLIEYIARVSSIIVDFPKRRKPQYSEETLAALRERGRALAARQKMGASLEGNGYFATPESTEAL